VITMKDGTTMPYRQRQTPTRASDYTVAEFAEKFNLAESTVRYKVWK
jgi:hypothetical protein